MIYTYRYLPHRIEGFHREIVNFFERLFLKDLQYFDEKELMSPAFAAIVNDSPKRLRATLELITESYHFLKSKDKRTLKRALASNCSISHTCADGRLQLVKYDDIEDAIFSKILKDFLTMLWDDYPQNDAIEATFGSVQTHFDSFVDPNYQTAFVCPFCGIGSLKPKGKYRNAYDHFLPKAIYPFVSINFENLFPICHDCNSDEKKSADTLYLMGRRRRAIYPADATYDRNRLKIQVRTKESYATRNFRTLLQNINWDYAITYAGKSDPRLATWDDVFFIRRRYKEHLHQYEKSWFEEIFLKRYKEDMRDGISFTRFREKLLNECREQVQYPLGTLRYVYFNFLFSISDVEQKINAVI